ncbi:MAG: hypothetical protein SNH13_01345 [Rikenellaceae bacterium]
MKIKILLISLLSLCVMGASAQRNKEDYKIDKSAKSRSSKSNLDMIYGVSVGYMIPYIDIDGGIDTSIKKGYKYGIMWGIDLGLIEIVPELWYSNFEVDLDGSGSISGMTLKNKSIEIPIIFSLDLPLSRTRLNVGPSFSVMCDNDLVSKSGTKTEFGRIKNNIGYVVGVSSTFFGHILVDTRFTGRFGSSTNELPTGSSQYNIKCYDLSLSVGYKF